MEWFFYKIWDTTLQWLRMTLSKAPTVLQTLQRTIALVWEWLSSNELQGIVEHCLHVVWYPFKFHGPLLYLVNVHCKGSFYCRYSEQLFNISQFFSLSRKSFQVLIQGSLWIANERNLIPTVVKCTQFYLHSENRNNYISFLVDFCAIVKQI